jgi:transposase-like protein
MSNDEQLQPLSPESSHSASTLTWKYAAEKVQRESDPDKILVALYAAEEALTLRQQQLGDSAGHEEERRELEKATRALLRLKTEKLGWPNPME